jgi:Helicase conserved C-terminal domain/ATP-dependent DNA helicase RecG C-terminal
MLSEKLGKHRVGLLHGRLSAVDKNAILAKFADTSTADSMNVLVATSIIESGIDIPQATVCVIENAEQFGLSQLHQIRGRVGRARTVNISNTDSHDTTTTGSQHSSSSNNDVHDEQQHQCHCVLLYDENSGNDALQRLSIMKQTKDGFEIAEADLKIRGPGELLGYKQKGYLTSSLRVTDLIVHAPLVPLAHEHARKLVSQCCELSKKSDTWKAVHSNYITETGLGLKLLSALFDFGWDLTFDDLNDTACVSDRSNAIAASIKKSRKSNSSSSSKVSTTTTTTNSSVKGVDTSAIGYIDYTDDTVYEQLLQQPPFNPLYMRGDHTTKTTTTTTTAARNTNTAVRIEYIEMQADGTATSNNISEEQSARNIAGGVVVQRKQRDASSESAATQQIDDNTTNSSNTDATSNTVDTNDDAAVNGHHDTADSESSEQVKKAPVRLTVTTLSTDPLIQIDTPQHDAVVPLDSATLQQFSDSWPEEFDDTPWTTTSTTTADQTTNNDDISDKQTVDSASDTASASTYKSMSLELNAPDVFKLRQNVYSNDYTSNSFVRTRRTAAAATSSNNYEVIDLTKNSDNYVFIVVDVETTGLTTAGNCMLQFAAMVLGSSDSSAGDTGSSSSTSFNAYCNPDAVISRHISVSKTVICAYICADMIRML